MSDASDMRPQRGPRAKRGALLCIVSAVSFAALGACGLDWDVLPEIGEEASVGTDGGALEGAAADAEREAGDDAAPPDAPDADAGPDVEGGPRCSPLVACAQGTYCRYPDHFCGDGGAGTCRPTPATSTCVDLPIATACGCDGEVHVSECAVHASNVDVAAHAACEVPAGTFRCGYRFCATNEVCEAKGPSDRTEYTCKPDRGCVLGCLCLGIISCTGGTCSVVDGHLVIRCP